MDETHAGRALAHVLERQWGLSRSLVRRLKREGEVLVDGQHWRVVDPVHLGQQVELWIPPAEAMPPLPLPLDIAFEDDHVLVVNKPAGMLVHPSRAYHRDTLVSGVAHHLIAQGLPPHIHPLHRLDADTSGLLLLAKHPFVLDRLVHLLERRHVVREYMAVVEGVVALDQGVIDAPIWSDPDGALRREVRPEGQAARTHYQVLQRWAGHTLVALKLETGRTHQIRVHMAHLGHPLVGDWLYGVKSPLLDRHALHAGRLSFPHPYTRETVVVTAPPPPDFAALLTALDAQESPASPTKFLPTYGSALPSQGGSNMTAHAARISRLGAAIAGAGVDLLLVTSAISMKYLTGWGNPSKRFSGLLISPAGLSALVVPALEVGEASHTGLPLFPWKDGTNPFKALADAAASLQASGSVLGVEKESIPLGTYEQVAAALQVQENRDISGYIGTLRAHKDEAELALMQQAADILNPALDTALAHIKPGMTELEIASLLERAMQAAGAEGVAFDTHVLTGARAALPHGGPTQARVQAGDVVLMDFGAMVGGYRSDITRCVSVGAWNPKMAEIYDIVLAAHDAAIAAAKPGVTYSEIDQAARGVIEAAGYGQYFTHRTGHGLGMEVHEEPYVVGGNVKVAEPGHVVTIEPGIYVPDVGGIRIEDDIVITAHGCRVITSWTTQRLSTGA